MKKIIIIISISIAWFFLYGFSTIETKEELNLQTSKNKLFNLSEEVQIKMIWVEPGSSMMGNSLLNQQYKVNITKGYWLAETELTQAQWISVMKDNPSHHRGDNLPVEQVSYQDVLKIIQKLNEKGAEFRLPTEAEWEYACRAGTKGAYYGERDLTVWHSGNSGRQSHEVQQKLPNAWGFYDMQGNILEWCSDWYQESNYSEKEQTDPKGPETGAYRVQRGGQFTGRIIHTEVYDRQRSSLNSKWFFVGLRLAHNPL